MSAVVADGVRELVREDPNLAPAEKETTVRFAKDQDRAIVFTSEAGIARRLLAHPETDVVDVNVLVDDGTRTVELSEVSGRPVVGVRAHVPVGALKVQLSPRATSQHAEVITSRALLGGDGQ